MARIHCYLLLAFVLFIVDPLWVKAAYNRRSLVNSTAKNQISNQDQAKLSTKGARNQTNDPPTYHERFQEEVSEKHLKEHMRYLYSQVNWAGPTRGLKSAEYLARKWREYGFDEVQMPKYRIITSEPQPSKPNMISIENNGNIEYTIEGKMKLYPDPTKNDTVDFYPFVGYSPNKTVQGDLVYVNYGKEGDYRELLKRNINVKGKVVLARSQPDIYLATSKGAIGLISFPDPDAYAPDGTSDEKTYPNAKWLSKDAVQMWAAYGGIKYFGDVSTPGYPSEYGYSEPIEDINLPVIPALPISYGQAKELLQRLQGDEAPSSWQIPVFNMTIRMGPGFQNSGSKVKLQVNTQLARTPIYNVIGTIKGTDVKNSIVIVGSQRDSWVFGAAEALSGTATINEIARVLGRLLKSGWRPRRTIKICSWGGENWRLAGSTEWAEGTLNLEEFSPKDVVGYINLDMVASGRFALRARGSPLFKNLTLNWAKKIQDPINPNKTMYDTWLEKNPLLPSLPDELELQVFSASNYKMFYDYLGIPSADFAYLDGDKMTYHKYPVYHTTEDTLYWMQKFVDPDFQIHKAMTQFSGGMILDLLDSHLIPYRLQDLTDVIKLSSIVVEDFYWKNKKFRLDVQTIKRLRGNAKSLNECAEKIDNSKLKFRLDEINDILRNAEKPLISIDGLLYRHIDKHIFFNFGFANFNSYQNAFPAIAEAIEISKNEKDHNPINLQLLKVANVLQLAKRVWKCYKF